MSDLLKKDAEFKWTPSHEEAFIKIRKQVTEKSFLWFPDWNAPCYLAVDSCMAGEDLYGMQHNGSWGSVLYQIQRVTEEDIKSYEERNLPLDSIPPLPIIHPVLPMSRAKIKPPNTSVFKEDIELMKNQAEERKECDERLAAEVNEKYQKKMPDGLTNLTDLRKEHGIVYMIKTLGFHSAKFPASAKHLSSMECELNGLCSALQTHYDIMVNMPINYVQVDNTSLVWLINMSKTHVNKIQRYLVKLFSLPIRLVIGHVSGMDFSADAFSRGFYVPELPNKDKQNKDKITLSQSKYAVVLETPFKAAEIITIREVKEALKKGAGKMWIPTLNEMNQIKFLPKKDLREKVELNELRVEELTDSILDNIDDEDYKLMTKQIFKEYAASRLEEREEHSQITRDMYCQLPIQNVIIPPQPTHLFTQNINSRGRAKQIAQLTIDNLSFRQTDLEFEKLLGPDQMLQYQLKDEKLRRIRNQLINGEEIANYHLLYGGGLLMFGQDQIVVPAALTACVIAAAHKHTMHGGSRLIERFIRPIYKINHLRQKIIDLTKGCALCTAYKPRYGRRLEIGRRMLAGAAAGKIWQIDIIEGLTSDGNYNKIMHMIDVVTTLRIAVALTAHAQADTTLRVFKDHILTVFGPAICVELDGASNLGGSKLWQQFCKEYGIELRVSIPHRSQQQGAIEKSHDLLLQAIRISVAEYKQTWVKMLPYICHCINTRKRDCLENLSAQECMFGRELPMSGRYERMEKVTEVKEYLNRTIQTVDEMAKARYKKERGSPLSFPKGTFCYPKREHATGKKNKTRFALLPWEIIIEMTSQVLCTNSIGIIRVFSKNNLKPVHERTLEAFSSLPKLIQKSWGKQFEIAEFKKLPVGFEIPEHWPIESDELDLEAQEVARAGATAMKSTAYFTSQFGNVDSTLYESLIEQFEEYNAGVEGELPEDEDVEDDTGSSESEIEDIEEYEELIEEQIDGTEDEDIDHPRQRYNLRARSKKNYT